MTCTTVNRIAKYYDNEDILLEYDGSNVLQASYTHGAGIDEPLIMERGGSSFFYKIDGLGSITDLTDNAGTVVRSYVYDSFGNIVLQNGSLENFYTYTGREYDSESGLYYYRARYLDPQKGRFIQEDPFPGFINLPKTQNGFPYVNNNSTNYIDPNGEFFVLATIPLTVAAVEGLINVTAGIAIYVGYRAYLESLQNTGKICNLKDDKKTSDGTSFDDIVETTEVPKNPNVSPPNPEGPRKQSGWKFYSYIIWKALKAWLNLTGK